MNGVLHSGVVVSPETEEFPACCLGWGHRVGCPALGASAFRDSVLGTAGKQSTDGERPGVTSKEREFQRIPPHIRNWPPPLGNWFYFSHVKTKTIFNLLCKPTDYQLYKN